MNTKTQQVSEWQYYMEQPVTSAVPTELQTCSLWLLEENDQPQTGEPYWRVSGTIPSPEGPAGEWAPTGVWDSQGATGEKHLGMLYSFLWGVFRGLWACTRIIMVYLGEGSKVVLQQEQVRRKRGWKGLALGNSWLITCLTEPCIWSPTASPTVLLNIHM